MGPISFARICRPERQPLISYYDAFAADLKIVVHSKNQFTIKNLALPALLIVQPCFVRKIRLGNGLCFHRSADSVIAFDNAKSAVPTATNVIAGGAAICRFGTGTWDTTYIAYLDDSPVSEGAAGPALTRNDGFGYHM